ncbi:hypothetical protein V1264_017781 [Littorina saxatilis]|uniref:Endonuclease-reverse transcriptase n=1 Tax=Littorina saxatilis TaxID=31220 RepID=A0AAN9GEY2_9CAEN
MEKNPTPENVARHSQIRTDFDKEKQRQTQNSCREKTASLNMEKDTQKLWQLTKTLNEDNSGRRKVTLHTNTGDVTGKTAANVFAKAFEADSTVTVPADRLKDVRSQTRAALHNTASTDLDPCMTERLILRELEEALRKLKQKKAPGPDGISNDMLKHLGPGAKRFLLSIYNLLVKAEGKQEYLVNERGYTQTRDAENCGRFFTLFRSGPSSTVVFVV